MIYVLKQNPLCGFYFGSKKITVYSKVEISLTHLLNKINGSIPLVVCGCYMCRGTSTSRWTSAQKKPTDITESNFQTLVDLKSDFINPSGKYIRNQSAAIEYITEASTSITCRNARSKANEFITKLSGFKPFENIKWEFEQYNDLVRGFNDIAVSAYIDGAGMQQWIINQEQELQDYRGRVRWGGTTHTLPPGVTVNVSTPF